MIYVFVLIVLFFVIGITGYRKNKKNLANLSEQGYEISNIVYTSNYVSGHQDIDKTTKTFLMKKATDLEIFAGQLDGSQKMPLNKAKRLAAIPISSIKDVCVEDKSTIQSRLSYAKLAFNVGLNEKHKNEFAFLTVRWNDGRFDHDTLFEFEDKNAMQHANTARNKILKLLR